MGRWIRFFIVLALGVAGGLYYGWVVNPTQYIDTTPDTLRIDYQADYVLMVAEVYRQDANLQAAAERLAILGQPTPLAAAQMAAIYAEQSGFPAADQALLARLRDDLSTWNP